MREMHHRQDETLIGLSISRRRSNRRDHRPFEGLKFSQHKNVAKCFLGGRAQWASS